MDEARTEGLGDAIRDVLDALDEHLRFAGPDRAAERSAWRPALEAPLPREGLGAEAVIAALRDLVAARGLRLGAPGFLGWIATAPPVVPATAALVGAVAAPQRWWVHPAGFLEEQARRWLAELLGLPPATAGALVSGGAAANLLCLAAARQRAGERRGGDPAADGLACVPEPRLYAGDTAHHVIERAAALLGLGRRALVRLPRPRRRGATVDVAALARALDHDRAAGRTPIAVVATAGDASTGAVDPIAEMAELAAARGVWLHVDGAYGAFAVLDPRGRERVGDLAAADSLAVDPHKWLAAPVGCGAAFVRDAGVLERALALPRAPYLEYVRRGEGDPASAFDQLGEGRADHTLEHTAPARGLAVWAALAEIGAAGLAARVARHLDCARRVAERARAEPELELLAEPALSIVCLRYRPPGVKDSAALERTTRAVLAAVRARGRVIPSSTRVDSKLAIRACFLGPRTALADADALVEEILAAGRAAPSA
ncbi:MAG TPA: pyridoxal-dependent decarboxylase [Kofleriaceae bacterium]|nr:pyridoxal-dependent decarboxylase [Kofleriaceae bacterium]